MPASYSKAMDAELKPHFFDGGLAFMFETKYTLKLTSWAASSENRDVDYHKTWSSLPRRFDPFNKGTSSADHLTAWRKEATLTSAKTPRASGAGQ